MTIETLKSAQAKLEGDYAAINARLRAFPRGAMGLTLECAKTAEWKSLKSAQAAALSALRNFNRKHAKTIRAAA